MICFSKFIFLAFYDLERVIDDFVLIAAMIGNDFLPHLPFCDINTGGLNALLTAYKQHLQQFEQDTHRAKLKALQEARAENEGLRTANSEKASHN